MYCPNCGTNCPDDAKFCPMCRCSLSHIKPPRKNRPPLPLIITLIVVVFGVVLAVLWVSQGGSVRSYEDCMALAARYLEELDYDQAEACYLEAIQIDPRQEESYLHLSQLYTELGRRDEAKEILSQGLAYLTDSQALQETYDQLVEAESPANILKYYLEETLTPALGLCDTGPFTCSGSGIDCVHTASGIISSRIADFDGDGQEELLIALLDNQYTPQEEWEGETLTGYSNAIVLQMYESTEDGPVLADEYRALDDVLGSGDVETDWIFSKTISGTVYLCGSKCQEPSLFLDGWDVDFFVISYEEEQFQTYVDYRNWGSWFIDDTDYKATLSSLRTLGSFNTTCASIESSGIPHFPLDESFDDILLSISGKNELTASANETYWSVSPWDQYTQTGDASSLGTVTVEIFPNKLPTDMGDQEFSLFQQPDVYKVAAIQDRISEVMTEWYYFQYSSDGVLQNVLWSSNPAGLRDVNELIRTGFKYGGLAATSFECDPLGRPISATFHYNVEGSDVTTDETITIAYDNQGNVSSFQGIHYSTSYHYSTQTTEYDYNSLGQTVRMTTYSDEFDLPCEATIGYLNFSGMTGSEAPYSGDMEELIRTIINNDGVIHWDRITEFLGEPNQEDGQTRFWMDDDYTVTCVMNSDGICTNFDMSVWGIEMFGTEYGSDIWDAYDRVTMELEGSGLGQDPWSLDDGRSGCALHNLMWFASPGERPKHPVALILLGDDRSSDDISGALEEFVFISDMPYPDEEN